MCHISTVIKSIQCKNHFVEIIADSQKYKHLKTWKIKIKQNFRICHSNWAKSSRRLINHLEN